MKTTKIEEVIMKAGIEFDNTFIQFQGLELPLDIYNTIKGYVKINVGLHYMTGRFDSTLVENNIDKPIEQLKKDVSLEDR